VSVLVGVVTQQIECINSYSINMIKAFISHSSKQKVFALKLYNLIGRDFCYIDCYDFEPAYKSLDEIIRKIESCTVFVLLISRESLQS